MGGRLTRREPAHHVEPGLEDPRFVVLTATRAARSGTDRPMSVVPAGSPAACGGHLRPGPAGGRSRYVGSFIYPAPAGYQQRPPHGSACGHPVAP